MPADTILHKVAYKGNITAFNEAFQEAGLSIDEPGAGGRTPLHRAISLNHVQLARVMIEDHKANVNSVDSAGFTPLHWAAIVNQPESAQVLIDNGADPNIQSKKGETALHLAASKGSQEMVVFLQRLETVDQTIVNTEGLTAYDVAKQMYKATKQKGVTHRQNMKLLRPSKGQASCSCR